MPVEIQKGTMVPSDSNNITFNFSNNVVDYVLGISYWKLEIIDNHRELKGISIEIIGARNGSSVTATVNASITPNSGGMNDETSKVDVCCIAVTEASIDDDIDFGKVPYINSLYSKSVEVQAKHYNTEASFLSGFLLSRTKSTHIKECYMRQECNKNDTTLTISANTDMNNGGDNHMDEASLDCGFVLANDSALMANQVSSLQLEDDSITVDFDRSIQGSVAVLLQTYNVTFHEDRKEVHNIGGGCENWAVQSDSGKVTLYNPRAFMDNDPDDENNDKEKEAQDNNKSNVSMVVFAIPQQEAE